MQKQIRAIQNGLKTVEGTLIFPYSAISKQGRDEIYDYIDSFFAEDKED